MVERFFSIGWSLVLGACFLLAYAIGYGTSPTWGFTFAGITTGLIGFGFVMNVPRTEADKDEEAAE